jgi:hypothetical protein
MLLNHIVEVFLPLFLILDLVAAVHRAPFNVGFKAEGSLQERQLFKNSTWAKSPLPSSLLRSSVCSKIPQSSLLIKSRNLIWGLFRSRSIIGLLDQIPCEIVEILENDENEADRFFTQIKSGQVPTLIENLPSEITDRITGLVGIALTIPSDLIEGAEAIVSDTLELFNAIEDRSIVDKLENVPEMLVSQITAGWSRITSGLDGIIDVITCAFADCSTTQPAGLCLATTTDSGESSTTANSNATPTFSSRWTSSPSPSPRPSWSPSPAPTSAYVPSSTAVGVVTIRPTRSQTSTALPSTQGTGQFTGSAAPMQLSFKATQASLIAAVVGIIGVVLLLW